MPFVVGDLSVTAIQVPHYRLETYAFRVESNSSVLAYSGDSAPSQELIDTARDADLFVCEATLLRGELDGEPRGHLSLDEAVAAFEASGAGRLLVTHRPCELPDPEAHELAYDGLELEV
jgi:ribonuclease BN (tRNA processing enzyme)